MNNTSPYSPMSNDVADRKNRTIKNYMLFLFVSNSPTNLFAEAILSAYFF